MKIKNILALLIQNSETGTPSKTKGLFFLLTLSVGVLALLPFNDFQMALATGDHGRDLYAFKKTVEGGLPYRDYSWVFGPLMPYYYSLFFRLFGISIQSVLLGQNLVILAAGLMVYLTGTVFLAPSFAFICATWYWAYRGEEFFYTYNHIGALFFLIFTLFCTLSYIRRPQKKYVWLGAAGLLFLVLIRMTIGVSTLVSFFGSLIIIDVVQKNPNRCSNRRLYAGLAAAVIALAAAVYAALLYPLPRYILGQSFPLDKSARVDTTTDIGVTLKLLWDTLVRNTTKGLGRILVTLLLMLSLAQTVLSIIRKSFTPQERRQLLLTLSVLGAFILFSLHEFLASGVFYRLFWIFPLILILMFLIFSYGSRNISSPLVKSLIYLTLLILALTNIYNKNALVMKLRSPYNLLQSGPTRVFLGQDLSWIQTVTRASRYLQDHTAPGEKIFVLPFDPLYYFLSQRDSANRQLIFFDHKKITPAQERAVIADLEKNHVRYILISNRSYSPHEDLGIFGVTYCPLIAPYIKSHFQPVIQYGNWNIPCGWAWNHAVTIYQRVE